MVQLKKRTVGRQTYYYLEHSVRKGGKVAKKEKYLGKDIPADIESIKKGLIFEIYTEKWFGLFDTIKKRFVQEQALLPPSAKEKELQTFAIKFTYDTNRIEGSRLTLKETSNLLENGIAPKSRPMADVKEAEAHEKVFYEMLGHGKGLSLQAILKWHKGLFENTKPDIAGRIRQHQVAISGSEFMPPFPAEVHPLLRDFFKWYGTSGNKLNPVELSALVHLKFVTIHPFSDGNGRISRLMMNFVLHRKGYPPLDIPYGNRNSYYNALERAQTRKDEDIFLKWFFRRYTKGHRRYLRER